MMRASAPTRGSSRRGPPRGDRPRRSAASVASTVGCPPGATRNSVPDRSPTNMRAVTAERQPARHPDLGDERRRPRPASATRVDDAFESARDVQQPVRAERHRGRVDDARRERLACAAGVHAKNRDRRLLSAGAAHRHVQAAPRVEHRTVDLVDAGRQRPRDVRAAPRRRRAVDSRTGMSPPSSAFGHAERDARVRCGEITCATLVADRYDRRIAVRRRAGRRRGH